MRRGFSCVGLENPKYDVNVGGVLRAAHCYGASLVAIRGKRTKVVQCQDTPKTYKHTPVLRVDDLKNIIPFNCVPVAVDLIDGATDLTKYVHPDRAFYIFGQEDGTLGKNITGWCRDVVYVPTVNCMNLAACVNVVLYDRLLKRSYS